VYEEERKKTVQLISSLKESYGLFYFYAGACAYCQAFSPILKRFADKYGWEVMAVSIDSTPSDMFPHWQIDNGLAEQWNVQTLPSVFAINPDTNHIIPIANGFTAIDVMEQRIMTIVKGQKR
jgi:conjugal transfer pilus assembly protein TraF